MANVSLYASVGSEITHYDVDVEKAALTRRATVGLPANVQYVWPHVSRRFLYAATSDMAVNNSAAAGSLASCGACSPALSPIAYAARSSGVRPCAAR